MPNRAAQPFTEHAASEAWLLHATEQLDAALTAVGRQRTGPVVRGRLRPWSALVTVETSAGAVWAKQPCPAMNFEARLQGRLAELLPGAVQLPLVDAPGLLITADHGPDLGDAATPALWARLLTDVARHQLTAAGHATALLATGLPDHAPGQVSGHFDALLSALSALPPTAPHRLDDQQRTTLEALRPALVEHADHLAAFGLAPTWQHGDLHPANVYSAADELRLFDFGDGQWAHPFEVLCVPFEVLERTGAAPAFTTAIAGYLATWGVSPTAFAELWPSVRAVYSVNRATTWWRALSTATPDEWSTWGHAPLDYLHQLTRFT